MQPTDGGSLPRAADEPAITVTAVEERLDISAQKVETGRVRIAKRTVEHEETVDLPLLREQVDIRRVAVNRVVDGPVAVRQEGEVTIVPVLEEVLVVSKQFVLKEELHISRRRSIEHSPQQVTLRREEVEITRRHGARTAPDPSTE